MKIEGGYILNPRIIKESWVAHAAPVIRETWGWLIMNANYKRGKKDGYVTERGQIFRTYLEIREGLSWKVGYRKQMYSENQMKNCMKQLANQRMITLTKQPRGNLITICNYNEYQDPENYESTSESSSKQPSNAPSMTDESPSIIEEGKEFNKVKNERKKTTRVSLDFSSWPEIPADEILTEIAQHRKAVKAKPITQRIVNTFGKELTDLTGRGISMAQGLDVYLSSSWKGLEAQWVVNHLAKNQSSTSNQQSYEEQVRQRDIELGLEPEGYTYEGESKVINGD